MSADLGLLFKLMLHRDQVLIFIIEKTYHLLGINSTFGLGKPSYSATEIEHLPLLGKVHRKKYCKIPT